MLLIHKGKILRQRAKLLGLPLMCLIDRAYPMQVIALQIGKIKWRKIFPLCIHTRGKFYTVRSH